MNCLFFNTRYNLHSVTSNAVANSLANYLPSISVGHEATRIDARFPSGSYNRCYWWRCGRVVTVRFYASAVLSSYNHLDPCYSGLPKPIYDSVPQIIAQWGGRPMQFIIVIDNNGNLCTDGNANGGTDVVVSGECSFTYITRDD